MTSKIQTEANKPPIATKHEFYRVLQRGMQKEARKHLIDLRTGIPSNSQQVFTEKHKGAKQQPTLGELRPSPIVGEGKGPMVGPKKAEGV